MKRLFASILALLLHGAAFAKEPAQEASTNLDRKHVVPFLNRVTSLFDSGFGPVEVKKISAMMEKLKPDEENELTFSVIFKGQAVSVRVRLFRDDVDAFDLYTFSNAEVAPRIADLIKKFAEDYGM